MGYKSALHADNTIRVKVPKILKQIGYQDKNVLYDPEKHQLKQQVLYNFDIEETFLNLKNFKDGKKNDPQIFDLLIQEKTLILRVAHKNNYWRKFQVTDTIGDVRKTLKIEELEECYPQFADERVLTDYHKYIRFYHEGTYVNDHQSLQYLVKPTDPLVVKLDLEYQSLVDNVQGLIRTSESSLKLSQYLFSASSNIHYQTQNQERYKDYVDHTKTQYRNLYLH